MHGIMSLEPVGVWWIVLLEFDECLMKFEISCSPWSMFVDYVKQTWLIPHKERFVKAWSMFVYFICRVEFAH